MYMLQADWPDRIPVPQAPVAAGADRCQVLFGSPPLPVPTRRVISVLAFALTGATPWTAAFGSDLWGDRALRIIQTSHANFPPALAAEGISEGEVRAVLHVDAGGKLVDYLVTAYTRRELA